MKRINAKTVIKAEILSLFLLAMALSFTGGIEIVKAIMTAGTFLVVIPTAFFAVYGRKTIKSGKTAAGLILFLLSYYLVVRDRISIIGWAFMVILGFILTADPWTKRDE